MKIDPTKKLAGVLIPVFALRHDSDLGIGDTTAVRQAIDFCARHEFGVLQTLPINETGGDHSPYSAISSVALDPTLMTVTPQAIPWLSGDDFHSVVTESVRARLNEGPVKYDEVKALKHALLRIAFDTFKRDEKNGPQVKKFAEFRKANERWLIPYALFRTLVDHHDGSSVWTQWEEHFRDPKSAIAFIAKSPKKADFERLLSYYEFVQWQAFEQWHDVRKHADEKNVRLMGDIPFGVSRYSADVWAQRELFDLEWSGGAPPEAYFQGDPFIQKWGQNWGVPLYAWKKHKADNYQWWRQRVGKATSIFNDFRIDHVLGFFRIYSFPWIPERNWEFTELTEEEAEEKTDGRLPKFLPRSDKEPEDAKLNEKEGKVFLEMVMDASGNALIVAEDLGVVPKYVRPLLKSLGMAGFAIPIFERDEEDRSFKPAEELEPLSLGTYATHDHEPVRAFYERLVEWWHGPDGSEGWKEVQRLMKFLALDEENPPLTFTPELHQVFLKTLMESPCWLALLMITDLLGTKQRFNEPGQGGDANWSQRLDASLDDLEKNPEYSEKIGAFEKLIVKTDRLPRKTAASKL